MHKPIHIIIIIDHPRSGVVGLHNFDPAFCLSVCLSACLSDDDFGKPWRRKFIFEHPLYLEGIRVKFVYEGHLVKVMVIGEKMVQNRYFRNVKLQQAITSVL